MSGSSLEPTGAADEGFDLELAVSTLASNSTDVGLLLRLLTEQLAGSLGDRLSVERRGGLFKRSGDIEAIQISLGDDVLRAEAGGATIRCTVGHSSGGIRIRSETVDMATWLRRLLGALQEEAARSETTRQALENLMIGGST